MNNKDNFQILRDERTKLVNRVADLETENAKLHRAASDALNILSRPHTHDRILSSYNAIAINKLLKKLHNVSQLSKAV